MTSKPQPQPTMTTEEIAKARGEIAKAPSGIDVNEDYNDYGDRHTTLDYRSIDFYDAARDGWPKALDALEASRAEFDDYKAKIAKNLHNNMITIIHDNPVAKERDALRAALAEACKHAKDFLEQGGFELHTLIKYTRRLEELLAIIDGGETP